MASQVPTKHKHCETTAVEVTDTQREAAGKEHATNKIPEENSKL